MKKYGILIVISLLLFTNANAKWKYNPGDIVEGEVVFGKKDSFKLPPGKFKVALNSREREFKDLLVYQIDEKSGLLRWSIHFYATGSTEWGWWNMPKFCDRTNVYFIQKAKGNKKYACGRLIIQDLTLQLTKGFGQKLENMKLQTE